MINSTDTNKNRTVISSGGGRNTHRHSEHKLSSMVDSRTYLVNRDLRTSSNYHNSNSPHRHSSNVINNSNKGNNRHHHHSQEKLGYMKEKTSDLKRNQRSTQHKERRQRERSGD